MKLYTVGHSTRSLDELVAILAAHEVEALVDVRRFPQSRRHPHFSRESLERELPRVGVEYRWFEALGGRRKRRKDSPHTAWKNPSFGAYADHMDTREFEEAMAALLELAGERRTAVMCAEALPHRCHRSLLSDWVLAHGHEVEHLLERRRSREHQMTEFARVQDGRLFYDRGQLQL